MSRSPASLRLLIFSFILFSLPASAQESLGIGTDFPDAQSIMDIQSDDRGILIPRMSTLDRDAIGQSAADVGLLIYNTTDSVFNYWDGLQWLAFPSMTSGDADWYIEGTSTPPSAITDDIFHSGNVAIGKNTADRQLDVESGGTADGAVRINHTGTGNTPVILEIDDASNSAGIHTGTAVNIGGTHDEELRGTHVSFDNTGDGLKFGHRVDLQDNGTGNKFGYATYITPSGGGNLFGAYTFANGTLNSTLTGYQLSSSQAGSGDVYGGFLSIGGTLTGLKVGMRTWIQGGGNGTHYGTWNVITNNWGNGTKYGTSNSISDGSNSPLGDKYGTYNSVRSDNGTLYGTYNTINDDDGGGSNILYGVRSDVGGTSSGEKYGTYHSMTQSAGGDVFATYNSLTGIGGSTQYGVYNDLNNTGTQSKYGVFTDVLTDQSNFVFGALNDLRHSGSGTTYGVANELTGSGTGSKYGVSNNVYGTGGNLYGVQNLIDAAVTGDQYGVYNNMFGDGSGDKYGSFNVVTVTGSGDQYAVYGQALRVAPNTWAGYFLGDVSIGRTGGDIYTFPAIRGTADQIMQTDGLGNVSWVDPGDLSDNDWTRDTVNGYLFPATLTDSVGIGTNTPTARLDVTDSDVGTGVSFGITDALSSNGAFQNFIESNTAGPFTGILNSLILNENATGEKTAIHNLMNYASANGPSGNKTGLHNDITSESGEIYGVRNDFNLTDLTNADWTYGAYNEWAPNSGRTYGTYNLFEQTGGTSGGARIYGTRTQIVNTNPSPGASGAYRVLGEYNDIEANGNGFVWGQYNRIFGDFNANYLSSGFVWGTQNVLFQDSAFIAYGTENEVFGEGVGTMYGTSNNITTIGFAYLAKVGTNNAVSADRTENVYGVNNQIFNSGTGDAYGTFTTLSAPGSGTGYGIYSEVNNIVKDYSAYLNGRVFIGDGSFVSPDGYIMPIGDGAAGQVIETDGAGNATWQDPDDSDWTRDAGNGYLYPSTIGDDIGIGTATPVARLHVSGGRVEFTNTTDATGTVGSGVLEIANALRIDGNEIITNTGNTLFLQFDNNGDLNVDNGSLYVDASTNFTGINTTTPATSLHVDHPSGTANGLSISNATDADRWHFYMFTSNTLRLYYNGGEVGQFNNASGVYTATSDARLKKAIEPLASVLDKLLKLRTVSYTFKQQDDDRRHVGLLAQEVEPLFPHLVYHTPASEENGHQDRYSMDYSGFGVLAVKAIQEQQELIEEKDERIESLEGTVKDLAERLAALEARLD